MSALAEKVRRHTWGTTTSGEEAKWEGTHLFADDKGPEKGTGPISMLSRVWLHLTGRKSAKGKTKKFKRIHRFHFLLNFGLVLTSRLSGQFKYSPVLSSKDGMPMSPAPIRRGIVRWKNRKVVLIIPPDSTERERNLNPAGERAIDSSDCCRDRANYSKAEDIVE
ncbi:hypothetical protein ARMGADRAFT_1023215 [Armillaria gallica]|uniref:Uncharacterized protein n=1 Tax=Armillaria gallica TaxID=47427 RepID=A0A2H3ESW9_ARMGA|nr:hypothetical protein ARMGADRAFT_1023215 [Armillaria gallica]